MTFAFCYNDQTIIDLKNEIKQYLNAFSELYPKNNMTPKMHFLSHFPEQLRKFGCLRNHSTHRMEAKNGAIKKPPIQNYKNICKTIAIVEEFKFMSKKRDSDWNKTPDFLNREKQKAQFRQLDDLASESFFQKYSINRADGMILFECDEIKDFGFNYKIGDFIIIKKDLNDRIDVIGKINKIIIANDSTVFDVEQYDILEYMKMTNCYKLKAKGTSAIKYLNRIFHKHPIYSFQSSSQIETVQIRYFCNILN
jgi:hypothetical protein